MVLLSPGVSQTVYEHDVYPYWWKLAGLASANEWQAVCNMIDQYDKDCGLILLGGATKQASHIQREFALAKATQRVNGFAIGRNIFWAPWVDYIEGRLELAGVADTIAERYREMMTVWKNS